MSWLAKVAPRYAVKRARARLDLLRLAQAEQRLARPTARQVAQDDIARARDFDAAAGGRRTAGWAAGSGSQGFGHQYLSVLRARSRDLTRNNPYAGAALGAIVYNCVGQGLRARLTGGSKGLRAAFDAWAASTDCDATGQHDLYGMQALVLRTVAECGECLVRRILVLGAPVGTVPLQLQVLEPEYLDTTATKGEAGNRLVSGIEYDRRGRPVAYHLYTEHPGAYVLGSLGLKSVRVPADEVDHIFRQDRPGQGRGIPWGAPVMTRLHMLDDYEDAALERARVAACFAAFVYDTNGDESTPGEKDAAAKHPMSERVEPGIIERLPPGTDVKFGSPAPISDYPEYVAANLRAIAAGYGVPYEVLTGDLSKTSFASSRIGWLEFDRRLKSWRGDIVVRQFLGPVWRWWAQVAAISPGHITDRVTVTWTPPRREMLNPREDMSAAVMRVRNGFSSWSEVIRELGQDPEAVAEELASDAARFDDLGIVLDCDPRRTAQSGQQQTASTGDTNDEPAKDTADPAEPAAAA